MLRITLPLAAILAMNFIYAQNFNIDSLLNKLKEAKNDTNKVNLLRSIGVSLAHQDPQKSIGYWKQGVALSKDLKYDIGLARSYINIGTGYAFLGKYDSSIIFSDTAIFYCQKIKDVNRLALIYLNQGDAYRNLQDFKKAVDAGASAVAAGSMFVFQRPHNAVLISYPPYQQLTETLNPR